MKFSTTIVLVFFGFVFIDMNDAVPVTVLNNDLSNSIEDGLDETDMSEDDITTHGLERLSSAATCLVAGIEYTHGQQIYRPDPCEFCLCLDGEMFCWWQDCPPTMEGPCRDRGPFSPCINVPANAKSLQSSTSSSSLSPSSSSTTTTSTTKGTSVVQTTSEIMSSSLIDSMVNVTDSNLTDSSTYTEEIEFDSSSETPNTSTAEEPKVCVVMGREYQIGDQLPHDTGNCIECICGQGAKVTCSPHQCAPAGEDINDYRPPGPRQQLGDVF